MKMVCIDCGQEVSHQISVEFQCSCGGLLEIVQDFSRYDADYLKQVFTERLSERMGPYASGVWRYKELIFPDLPEEFIVTKYEGNTGLYAPERVREYVGIRHVFLKAQSENPSGSFKDNGMTVAVSHGKSAGFNKFACTSTGNTSSSLSMYAAMANAESYVFVPNKDISLNKVLQTLAYGAMVFSVRENYDDGIQFLKNHSQALGLYVCNSVNPFRIEGQKSIIFEAAQSLNWELPEWIVVPGGALSNASALGKGLQDLYTLGFIKNLPRVAVVQAEGASPFHKMVSLNEPFLTPDPSPKTRASALNIGHPPSWKKAMKMLEQTKGVTVSVSDEEILNAKAVIDRSGVGCEPASAATVAGLKKLVLNGTIDQNESALCILTGHLLKDTEALKEYHFGNSALAEYQNKLPTSELTYEAVSEAISSRC